MNTEEKLSVRYCVGVQEIKIGPAIMNPDGVKIMENPISIDEALSKLEAELLPNVTVEF